MATPAGFENKVAFIWKIADKLRAISTHTNTAQWCCRRWCCSAWTPSWNRPGTTVLKKTATLDLIRPGADKILRKVAGQREPAENEDDALRRQEHRPQRAGTSRDSARRDCGDRAVATRRDDQLAGQGGCPVRRPGRLRRHQRAGSWPPREARTYVRISVRRNDRGGQHDPPSPSRPGCADGRILHLLEGVPCAARTRPR